MAQSLEQIRRIQELQRQGLVNQPKPGSAPIVTPEQPALGALSRSMPIRGRTLPVSLGSLAPALKALRNLALMGE
mgnify:CR=1 FL=1